MKKFYSFLFMALFFMCMTPALAASANSVAHAFALSDSLDSDDETDGEDDGEDEEEPDPEPYVEPSFTVTFDIDRPEAVSAEIRNCYGVFVSNVTLVAGDNEITVDPGDNYLMFYVADGYAFDIFNDDDQSSSYLQYDHQTSPVTIRKAISLGSEESIVVDGHHFTVRTYDLSALSTYTITVNVDIASKVEMRIGSSSSIESGSNRDVNLSDGINTVTYTSDDAYLHFRAVTFMETIQSATFNDKNVVTDGSFWPVYSVPLKGAKTDGGVLDIVAKLPELKDDYTFTVLIDDIESVRYFTRMPANRDISVNEGINSVSFAEGDYFEVWCTNEAYSCTNNGEPVEFNDYTRVYRFTPTPDGVFDIRFKEPVVVATFSFVVDDASKVSYLMNNETEEEFELVNGSNIIPIANPGDEFSVGTVGNVAAYSFKCDGDDVPRVRRVYSFVPEVDSKVVVYFSEPAAIVMGDANDDGELTIADVVAICNHILGNTPDKFNPEAADLNGDKSISTADIVSLVNIILTIEK